MDKLRENIKKLIPIFFAGFILVAIRIISLREFFLFCGIVILVWMVYRYSKFDKNDEDGPLMVGKVICGISFRQVVFILITAVVVITICSKSSPVYPFNDWVDANCFMTVGKSMLHGLVPYRDLYEQKGPLLYILHALAALISEKSFFGVYILEIIACFSFLFLSYKSMRLFYSKINILTIPVLAAVVYSALCFCHGDSAEELCLPFLAYAIYLGVKMIHCNIDLTKLECFLIGVTSACVLWIKFTLVGFYVGWICVPGFLLLRNRQYKKLIQMLLCIAIGVATLSLPILLYFGINDALDDLFTVYFYNNLFTYSAGTVGITGVVTNLHNGYVNFRQYNILTMISVLLGAMAFLKQRNKSDFVYLLTTVLATFIFIYIGGRYYAYYSLILSAFAPFGILATCNAIQNFYVLRISKQVNSILRNCGICAVCIACGIFAFTSCDNIYLLQYKKADMPQYQFAEEIAKTKDATLLNYGFLDGGFYTTTGIVPTCKYFCNLNIPLEEMMESQNAIVENGGVDYVVTKDSELDSSIYKCIDTSTFYFEGSDHTYYLYQLCR